MSRILLLIVVLAFNCTNLLVAHEPGRVIWKYDLKSDSKGTGPAWRTFRGNHFRNGRATDSGKSIQEDVSDR